MTEQFEHKGKWKLPESEWFNGTLRYDPENGATLEVYGSFNSFLDRTSKNNYIRRNNRRKDYNDAWYRKTRSSSMEPVVGLYKPNIKEASTLTK